MVDEEEVEVDGEEEVEEEDEEEGDLYVDENGWGGGGGAAAAGALALLHALLRDLALKLPLPVLPPPSCVASTSLFCLHLPVLPIPPVLHPISCAASPLVLPVVLMSCLHNLCYFTLVLLYRCVDSVPMLNFLFCFNVFMNCAA